MFDNWRCLCYHYIRHAKKWKEETKSLDLSPLIEPFAMVHEPHRSGAHRHHRLDPAERLSRSSRALIPRLHKPRPATLLDSILNHGAFAERAVSVARNTLALGIFFSGLIRLAAVPAIGRVWRKSAVGRPVISGS